MFSQTVTAKITIRCKMLNLLKFMVKNQFSVVKLRNREGFFPLSFLHLIRDIIRYFFNEFNVQKPAMKFICGCFNWLNWSILKISFSQTAILLLKHKQENDNKWSYGWNQVQFCQQEVFALGQKDPDGFFNYACGVASNPDFL